MNDNIKGRASSFNPKNRFEKLHTDYSELLPIIDDGIFEEDTERKIKTEFFTDHSKTILSKNNSPDLFFQYSINPYRGCEHGCIYCYARPSHDYLSFSSGLDFETKIVIKPNAPELLAEAFSKKSWKPERIMLSGNTDCYQPAERRFRITRGILEVFLNFRNPVHIITKNALILRDLDLLTQLAELNLVHVTISITSLKPELARVMEPRTSAPLRRLGAVKKLSENNVPVGVNMAPIIPGLTDEEIPSLLKAASEHGARSAGFTLVRLPYEVKELFTDWVQRNFPDRYNKIVNRIKSIRNGKLNSYEWGKRTSGEGEWADTISVLFHAMCKKYKLNENRSNTTTEHFRRYSNEQMDLFE